MDPRKISLQAAITATPLSSHRYEIDIHPDVCFGKSVHGGFLASIITQTAQQHFSITLKDRGHPHPFDLHIIFFSSATAGKAQLEVEDSSLGSGFSTIHVTLLQGGRKRTAAYVSNTDMHAKQGAEFNTKFQITPALPSVRIQDLVSGSTEQWVQWDFPWHPKSLLKPYTHFRFFIPTNGPLHLSLTDVWITPKDDDAVFTTRTLGMIADIWPRMVENYCPDSGWNTANLANRAKENAPSSAKAADFSIEEHQQAFWYPTLSMTLDVKKTLEPHGVKWLFMRAQARQIKNGRMDVTVVILDQRLELVAISNHVCLVISNANGPLRRLPHYEQVKL